MVPAHRIPCHDQSSDRLHHEFLLLLPRIELHARVFFRDIRCPDTRADKIAETVGLAWHWYLQLVDRGRDVNGFAGTFVRFAARAVKCGRRVCGQEHAKDAMSRQAQIRHRFAVERLPDFSKLTANPLDDALVDNTITPVDEQACFRIDFPGWLRSRSARDRRIVGDLMMGERTLDVSRKYGMTAARISQLRRDFLDDWQLYCGEFVVDDEVESLGRRGLA